MPVEPGPKVHTSAVVLIPPEAVWEPIQAIRRVHDPKVGRWMPHATLLYPFVPEGMFGQVAERLAEAISGTEPFEVRLAEFSLFAHRKRSATLWLRPEPAAALRALQARLQGAAPWCDEVRRHRGGFTPHLSVGRFPGEAAARNAAAELAADWRPVTFLADHVSLIARSGEPDDPFVERMRVDFTGQTEVLTCRGGMV